MPPLSVRLRSSLLSFLLLLQALSEESTAEEMDYFRSNAMATNAIAGLSSLPQVGCFKLKVHSTTSGILPPRRIIWRCL